MRTYIAALLTAAAFAYEAIDPREYEFMEWIAQHGRSYGTRSEFEFRLARWLEADEFIKEVNALDSGYTHTAGHNHLSDFTREEYRKRLNNVPAEDDDMMLDAPEDYVSNGGKDWRSSGCVTPVKDQGQCGSCWAFSATETVESAYCIEHGSLYTLSPQMLVDCAKGVLSNHGCNGGWYYYAWDYLQTHGQMLESDYPYTARDGTCEYQASKGKVKTTS